MSAPTIDQYVKIDKYHAPQWLGDARHATVPRHGQAGRLDLQSRLHVLLLPEQADAARRPRRRPHGRRGARALRPRLHRERHRRRGRLLVAGRRADAARPRVLPQGRRAAEEVREARPADRERPADQRHAARRGLGPVPQGAPVPRRPEHRRPARDPRPLPDHQARRSRRSTRCSPRRRCCSGTASVQHADLREPLQRLAAARRLSLPAPRARLDLHAVHPDRRDQGLRDDRAAALGSGTSADGRRPQARPDHPDSVVTAWSVDPEEYGYFLCKVWDEWLARDVGKVLVNFCETLVVAAHGAAVADLHPQRDLRQGRRVEHDGSVYALRPLRLSRSTGWATSGSSRSATWCSRRRR